MLALAPMSLTSAAPKNSNAKSNSENSSAAGNEKANSNKSIEPAVAPKKAEVEPVKVLDREPAGNSNKPADKTEIIDTDKTNPGQEKKDTQTLTQREVVPPGLFKNDKLVAGKFATEQVNEEADQTAFSDADEKCGVEDEQTKVNANASLKTVTVTSKTDTTKKPATSSVKTTNNKVTNANAAAAKEKVAAKKAEKEAEECLDYLVVFKAGTTISDIEKTAKGAGGKVLKKFHNAVKAAIINGPPSKMEALVGKNPNIRLAELDGQVVSQGIQTDAPWGLDRIDQNPLPLSTTYDDKDVTGFSIPAYVVDTGIFAGHQDFGGRVAAGFTSITDGLGSADCNGHGTHVAGSIAGSTYGAAKRATLIPVRVLDCAGSGTYSSVMAGLDWIAANHPAGAPGVVNMSLGGAASSTLDAAVRGVIAKGLTVVVAAGNSNIDACTTSPARVKEAITVAASTSADARASFSNFGSCVDVFAPGASITSAWISSSTSSAVASGTSMASPHVAGIVARFLVNNPATVPYNVEQSVINGATQNVLSNIGAGSPNRLLYFEFAADTSTPPTTPTEDDGGSSAKPGKETAPGQTKRPKR